MKQGLTVVLVLVAATTLLGSAVVLPTAAGATYDTVQSSDQIHDHDHAYGHDYDWDDDDLIEIGDDDDDWDDDGLIEVGLDLL